MMAARSTPGRVPSTKCAIAVSAPVLPALTHAQARPSCTRSTATRIEVSFLRRIASRGLSSIASQVVAMEDKPREAIRRKKDSSMRVAVDLVQDGRACACVSAGNTGALTAIAHFVLGTLPGVERAAIISAIPAAHGHTHMLDLGANTKATPEQLRQFAAMGAIIARDVYGLAAPRIGLLNIGEEDMKGHEVVQAAHALLTRSGLNYVGFVEGDDIFAGTVDVVVTDGV